MKEHFITEKMMKIVVNRCYGGFGLSKAAYAELGIPWDGYGYAYNDHEKRTAPELVVCIEKLEQAANEWSADLRVVEIPDDIEWKIIEFDGLEHVAEEHRTW